MRNRLTAVQQAGPRQYPHPVANADDDGALAGLRAHPGRQPRIRVFVHGRHDHVVGAVRVMRVERGDVGIRLCPQGGKEPYRSGIQAQRPDLGGARALEHRVGHHEVGQLGVGVMADHRDTRQAASRDRPRSGQWPGLPAR
nr:hypothetical protein [Achromobacter xylosoxidans]